MTKLEEQLILYRSIQKARKEKIEQEAREAKEAEEAKRAKDEAERKKEMSSSSKSGYSFLNFFRPSQSISQPRPTPPAPRYNPPPQLRREPRVLYFHNPDDDDDFEEIDDNEGYADDLDIDYNYVEEEEKGWTKLDVVIVLLKFALYIVLQTLAVLAEWGAVFFAISLLYFIYYNTRTRRRLIGEPSAYSVFNDGCEPIDGALDADRLINQLSMGQMIL